MDALKDLKTTIPGIIIILVVIVVSVALFKGLCTFDRFWEIILFIFGIAGLAGGTKLITMDSNRGGKE